MVPDGLNNKGKIFISNSSPQCVLDAYSTDFQKEFSIFLRSRAEEVVVSGGRMVLSFLARPSSDPTAEHGIYPLEFLAHALMAMVSEGLIEQEKVDFFNILCPMRRGIDAGVTKKKGLSSRIGLKHLKLIGILLLVLMIKT